MPLSICHLYAHCLVIISFFLGNFITARYLTADNKNNITLSNKLQQHVAILDIIAILDFGKHITLSRSNNIIYHKNFITVHYRTKIQKIACNILIQMQLPHSLHSNNNNIILLLRYV